MGFEYLISLLIVTVPMITYGMFKCKDYRKTIVGVGLAWIVIGGLWDCISTNILRLWSFNPNTVIGVWIFGLPLEEWMFFPLSTMAIATVTLLISDRIRKP